MLKIKVSEERKRFLAIFMVSILIYSTITYVSTTPRPKEQFFQLYALGETRMVEKYYPNDNSTIPSGTPVKWFLGVTNCMGSVEYVIIKAKLGNQTLQQPNETNVTPANIPTLIEFSRVLLDNETWETSFAWKIMNVDMRGEMAFLTLNINNKTITVQDIGAKDGRNFRIIFELWTLDKETENLIFGWKTQRQHRAAWLQIWFNATIPQQQPITGSS